VYLVYDFHNNNNNFDFFNIGLTVNDIVNCTMEKSHPAPFLNQNWLSDEFAFKNAIANVAIKCTDSLLFIDKPDECLRKHRAGLDT